MSNVETYVVTEEDAKRGYVRLEATLDGTQEFTTTVCVKPHYVGQMLGDALRGGPEPKTKMSGVKMFFVASAIAALVIFVYFTVMMVLFVA